MITLHRDPADIDTPRRQVLVPERILRLDDAARLFGDYPRERMTHLVNVNLFHPRHARVAIQVFGEGVRRERAVASESVHPVAALNPFPSRASCQFCTQLRERT